MVMFIVGLPRPYGLGMNRQGILTLFASPTRRLVICFPLPHTRDGDGEFLNENGVLVRMRRHVVT